MAVSVAISKMFNDKISWRGFAWYRTDLKQLCPRFPNLDKRAQQGSLIRTVANVDYPHRAMRRLSAGATTLHTTN
jgi:hypothetical protein